jgi:hypothetical protein
MSSPYTPGPGGYALGVVASWLAFLAPLMIFFGPYVVVAAPVVIVVGTPIGLIGVVVTHLACREAPHQGAHVLVAGLSGFTLMVLLVGLFEGDDAGPLLLVSTWVGIAAAIGRASVIPFVSARGAARQ